ELPEERYDNDLSNPNSTRYRELEDRVKKTCTPIYSRQFGDRFVRCFVKRFRPAVELQARDVAAKADIGVVLRNDIPTADLPTNEFVAQTLVNAANSNETFSLQPLFQKEFPSFMFMQVVSFRNGSVINDVRLNFDGPSVPHHTNIASVLIQASSTVSGFDIEGSSISVEGIASSGCTPIYSRQFGDRFVRCFVKRFRPAVELQARDVAAKADIGVVLRNDIPTADLPTNEFVAQTLVNAANSNETFSVSLDASLINVISGPVPSSTESPTNVATTAAVLTTTSTVAASPTPSTTTTSAVATVNVSFRSRLSKFTSDLQNPSSEAFKNRVSMITSQLQPLFQKEFPSFMFMQVVSFRNGSVINDVRLNFDGPSVPHHTNIASVLIQASSTVSGFDIEGSSISVEGIASSGVRQNISLITAFSLILLSWLLSNYQ
ncbi:uncharacterized protein LOC130520893, partial [Takifugu flavidus]|uniref:uncharacterized protein LOC130520893 n=1 Tax=Takifugu flavidus TaxID=433684 RepID=UPI0025447973